VSADRPTYCLTLRSEPSSIPAGRRLAGLLKLALRAFHFRCLEARELPAGANGAGEQASAHDPGHRGEPARGP
jgi:hypothetical protein